MSGMSHGRIPMDARETEALDELVREHGIGAVSRRDPNEEGPLLFKLRDGRQWEIAGDGVVKLTREAHGG